MITKVHNGGWVIILSFIIAIMLTAMPLPDWAVSWRPSWLAMVLIYWCMALPDRIGIGIGWLMGLLLDVQQGTVLGQHALGLSVIAYITIVSYQRVRVYPLAQQALIVCIYLLVFQFFNMWIRGIMGIPSQNWSMWLSALTSMILWPWLFIILRDVRRRYNVY